MAAVAAGGAVYDGDNTAATPKRNWESVTWSDPTTPPADAIFYYVCAMCYVWSCNIACNYNLTIDEYAAADVRQVRGNSLFSAAPPDFRGCTPTSANRIATHWRDAMRRPPPLPPAPLLSPTLLLMFKLEWSIDGSAGELAC
jgi:hypothetical protein